MKFGKDNQVPLRISYNNVTSKPEQIPAKQMPSHKPELLV